MHAAGALLKAALEKRGIKFRMRAKTQEILGDERVTRRAVRETAKKCRQICSSWPSACGPTSSWPRSAGLACDRGILVDDTPADLRPGHLRGGRVRAAPRARPSGWWRRSGSRRASARSTSPRSACRASRAPVNSDAAQGLRHRSVLGRRFRGGAEPRVAGAAGQAPRHLQTRRYRGQPGLRRGAVSATRARPRAW